MYVCSSLLLMFSRVSETMPNEEQEELEVEVEGDETAAKDKDRKHDSGAADLEKVIIYGLKARIYIISLCKVVKITYK